MLLEAKAFRDSVAAGEAKAVAEESVPTSSSVEQDDSIPF